MLARLIATVAALLLACASPQADAYVRAERVSVSLADLAAAERSEPVAENAPPAKSAANPKTAPPARATLENSTSGKNAALTHCHVWENWSPLQNCASEPGVYQWDGTRLAGRTNATGTSLGDYQHAYGWPLTSREGTERSFIHADTHGTPQLITTATGAIAGWTRTDVWGVEQAQSGTQSVIGYTGYLKDPLIDELYAQARQYRAGSGRFTSVDPWEGDNLNPVTLNKYLYGNGNPGTFVDPDGRTAELMAAQEKLAAFRTRGLTGLTAAKMGVMEAPWYQKPGMLLFGAVDVAQTIVGGGLEGVAAGSNLAANTLIVAAGEMGAKDASLFAPAYEQSAGELYGDLDLTFQAVDAVRADPGAAATAAISAPIESLEKAVFENDSASQVATAQQFSSLPGFIRHAAQRMAAGSSAHVPQVAMPAQTIIEGPDRAPSTSINVTYYGADLSHAWTMKPTERGNYIESHLSKTEYSLTNGWYNVGQTNNGYFPLVDFQQENTLVSLKSVDTNGSSWLGRMESHIDDLATNGATVNDVPANMVLDLRVQPGGTSAAAQLINYGKQQGVTVVVKEFK